MRVSCVALLLLCASRTAAFVPSSKAKLLLQRIMVSPHHDKSLLSLKAVPDFPEAVTAYPRPEWLTMETVQEARQCLDDIEQTALKAKDHVAFLEEVAHVVRAYLGDHSPATAAGTGVENVQEAQEYLVNIEKAYKAAQSYLVDLEDMALGIKSFLAKFQDQYARGGLSDEKSRDFDEAKVYLDELEETVRSAKEYLSYLKRFPDAVHQYLDPKGIEDFMREKGSSPAAAAASVATPKIMPPPAPPLEIDTTPAGPRPVKRIVPPTPVGASAAPPVGANYLDSLRSNASKSGNAAASFTSYLDSIAPSMQQKKRTMMGSSYLDSMQTPVVETPTSHFNKGFADSKPHSEDGPPEKGRGDVSHMDRMGPPFETAPPAVTDRMPQPPNDIKVLGADFGMPSYYEKMPLKSPTGVNLVPSLALQPKTVEKTPASSYEIPSFQGYLEAVDPWGYGYRDLVAKRVTQRTALNVSNTDRMLANFMAWKAYTKRAQ